MIDLCRFIFFFTLIAFVVFYFKKRNARKKAGENYKSDERYLAVSKKKKFIGWICILSLVGGCVLTSSADKVDGNKNVSQSTHASNDVKKSNSEEKVQQVNEEKSLKGFGITSEQAIASINGKGKIYANLILDIKKDNSYNISNFVLDKYSCNRYPYKIYLLKDGTDNVVSMMIVEPTKYAIKNVEYTIKNKNNNDYTTALYYIMVGMVGTSQPDLSDEKVVDLLVKWCETKAKEMDGNNAIEIVDNNIKYRQLADNDIVIGIIYTVSGKEELMGINNDLIGIIKDSLLN